MLGTWGYLDGFGSLAKERVAWEYCNPLVMLEAVLALRLFLSLHLGSSKVINLLARGSFTVFVTHDVFISHLGIEHFAQGPTPVLLLHLVACCVVLYLLGWALWFLWSKTIGRLVDGVLVRRLSGDVTLLEGGSAANSQSR